jgi:lytic murein transglycosylase
MAKTGHGRPATKIPALAGRAVPRGWDKHAAAPHRRGRSGFSAFARVMMTAMRFTLAILIGLMFAGVAHADAFQQWLQAAWPDVHKLGVSRATFEAAIKGLAPDYSLPDLAVPGRVERAPSQPEFVETPEQYLRPATFARLAARGKDYAAHYRDTLSRIERDFGVPGTMVLAIWARETDYGRERQPHDALRVLATQAYVGKRKEFFRQQFLYALKMLQDGVPRAELRSSWGGAMGLTQFLPTEFYKYAVDFDGDGRADLWHSVPDALASAAKQLKDKGWRAGEPWAVEVTPPAKFDCTVAEPSHTLTIAEWLRRGFTPVYGRKPGARALATEASLLMPEGAYGPAFLTPKNYYVIKEYNYSDLYVLFVGHLSDLIGGAKPFATPWSKDRQLKTSDVAAMQRRLTALGLYHDKIDGKAGMLTRAALGAYQKAHGLKVDCWPSEAVLAAMRR